MRDLRMDLDFAKIPAQLELLLRAEILVAEENNAALGNEKCELIFLLVGQVLELQADNFGADVRSQILDFFGGREECGLVLVCASAGVDVLAVLISDSVDILEKERAGWAVLY